MTDQQASSGQPLWATDLERWALSSVNRHGIKRFVAFMTACATTVSVLLVGLAWGAIEGFDDPASWSTALVLSAVVPAVVAPPIVIFCARLIARLETARRLLRRSSVTDELTGIANRRGFFAGLDELGPWQEAATPLLVGMVDIDRFKSLNDEYGHALGDQALTVVATWLRNQFGQDGLVGRLGGDEFAFVAPAGLTTSVPPRRTFEVDGVAFSASIGTVRTTAPISTDVLHDADVALYQAKRALDHT